MISFALDWMDNEEWYRYNYEKEEYELTDKAPPEARESFMEYKKEAELFRNNCLEEQKKQTEEFMKTHNIKPL